MTERLLQFIWQFQYFNKNELATTATEELWVISPGQFNTNQGPDFSDAKIRIGPATWAGSVELHLKTSDWKKHHHQADKRYSNVILHVVWEHDEACNEIPVLELKTRVPKILLQRYAELMLAGSFIPCEKNIASVKDITWKSWKERLLAERLLRKSAMVEVYLMKNNYHWEEVFWWLLTRNMGMIVNADAFETIAKSLPLNIVARHKNQVHQLEALLLGQAGLLEKKFEDDYPAMLRKEYRFLKTKYALKGIHIPPQFLRMRPGNFPTIRLAQLAMLIHDSAHLFARIREAGTVKEVKKWFDVTANDYWHYHYRPDEPGDFKKKSLGSAMTDSIIINTIVPVLFTYGAYHREQKYKDKVLQWLEQTVAESNSVIKKFSQLGIESKTALDSQALIELKNEYCNRKRCLDCGVGNYLLKSADNLSTGSGSGYQQPSTGNQ